LPVVGGVTGGKVAGFPLAFATGTLTVALALVLAFSLAFAGFASPLMKRAFALADVNAFARAALLIMPPFSRPVAVVVLANSLIVLPWVVAGCSFSSSDCANPYDPISTNALKINTFFIDYTVCYIQKYEQNLIKDIKNFTLKLIQPMNGRSNGFDCCVLGFKGKLNQCF
jgi:hypothetical protein